MERIKKVFCNRLIFALIFVVLSTQLMGFSKAKESQNVVNVEDVKCEEYNADVQVNTNKFYYNQLNDVEKEIYNTFYISKELFIGNKSFICISGKSVRYDEYINSIRKAFYAYLYDNPNAQVYLEIACVKAMISEKYGQEYYDYVITPNRDTNSYTRSNSSSDEIIAKLEALETTTKEFVDNLSGNDYEKLIQIHNWLIENASYDKTYSLPNAHNAYGAIIQKECVCDGYAYAFKYAADMAGLNVIFATGYVITPEKTSEFHAWNYAYIDEEWFLVDVTWNLGLKSNIYLLINPEDEEIFESLHKSENKRFVYPY